MKYLQTFVMLFFAVNVLMAQERAKEEIVEFETNTKGNGVSFEIEFQKGPEFYYPIMAFWIEDENGNYIQTLYVSQSIAKGVFNYGQVKDNRWIKDSKRRPAALPYWAHKRGIKAKDGLYIPTPDTPIADAYTGPTPQDNFILKTKADEKLPKKFKILMEINQSWDWNEYWTNDRFPDDEDYKTSSQPALVYSVDVDLDSKKQSYVLQLIGHSHYSGKDGKLYTDLSTITTAKEIVDKILINIKK
ncbi:MAG: DUF2271 domain-containing protein [Bacteroidetes bacterium]|nr:DUF2271 domain-containing protein [Bacteroidota bacterium]